MTKGRKALLTVLGIVFAFFILIIIIVSIPSESEKEAKTETVITEKEVVATYSLPAEEVFIAYVMDKLDAMETAGTLVLDTFLIDPIEIELRDYKLNTRGLPQISMTAWVKEIALGAQGREITQAIVKITLDWLIEQGFNPAQQYLDPVCSISRKEQGATGQDVIRSFGRSTYNYNTDSIDWRPAQ